MSGLVSVIHAMTRGFGDGASTPAPVIPLIIISGESNSGGRALNSSASPSELAPRSSVQIFNNITFGFQNLDIGTNNLLGHSGLATDTEHSWELEMANRVEAGSFGNNPMYLVKTGQGGTKIENWAVGNTAYNGVDCWQVFQSRVDSAISQLHGMSGLDVQPYLFYTQGINDAIAGTNLTTWKAATIAHFAKIRAKYGDMPIVMTKLMTTYNSFNPIIDQITAEVTECYSVVTADATLRDVNHWDYAGQKLVAGRMMDTILAYYTL